jgi:hypothetical protein
VQWLNCRPTGLCHLPKKRWQRSTPSLCRFIGSSKMGYTNMVTIMVSAAEAGAAEAADSQAEVGAVAVAFDELNHSNEQ